jgi:hypothetical protein
LFLVIDNYWVYVHVCMAGASLPCRLLIQISWCVVLRCAALRVRSNLSLEPNEQPGTDEQTILARRAQPMIPAGSDS